MSSSQESGSPTNTSPTILHQTIVLNVGQVHKSHFNIQIGDENALHSNGLSHSLSDLTERNEVFSPITIHRSKSIEQLSPNVQPGSQFRYHLENTEQGPIPDNSGFINLHQFPAENMPYSQTIEDPEAVYQNLGVDLQQAKDIVEDGDYNMGNNDSSDSIYLAMDGVHGTGSDGEQQESSSSRNLHTIPLHKLREAESVPGFRVDVNCEFQKVLVCIEPKMGIPIPESH